MTRNATDPNGTEAPDTVDIPEHLPLLMLADVVMFPGSVIPVRVTDQSLNKVVDDAVMREKLVAVVTLKDTQTAKTASVEDAHEVGCVGRILQLQHLPDNSMNVVIQALQRFRIMGIVQRKPYVIVQVALLEGKDAGKRSVAPLMATVKLEMKQLIDLSPNIPDGASAVIESIEEPGFLADLIAANLNISTMEKQKLLATLDKKQRLERTLYLLSKEVELMKVSHKIQQDVKSSIDKSQRDYFLRQQLKAIQAELGEGDEERSEADEFRTKIEALDLKPEVLKEVLRELNRLSQMNDASAEYHVIATYLNWITDLPWNMSTEDQLDIRRAEEILDEDHYGLERVKKRIVEYLAVRKLKPEAAGPILCLVGPPGVGKTSLGKSVARALGRTFSRMSLGGVRDEAEIRGHRKTYVGALPGRIIQNLRKTGSNNPVFMLDEIDKLGSDFRGDPSSALLEVLDPAQNDTFVDLYLGVPFDLSKVMFIATANVSDTIPWALRDRMEIIHIPGYTLEEKLQIAQKYLVPRQLDAHGLRKSKLSFTVAALRTIIESYTREAGVRNLEREIANVCRGTARKFAEGLDKKITIRPESLAEYLGRPRIQPEVAERTRLPGVATGLAYTPTGGDILFIEATRMTGRGQLILTGQLGDVMKESAQAVLSYVRANADQLGIDAKELSESDLHIHVPQGAVPKDGPSAGVTLLTAVVSLLTGKRVKNRLAMTGEVTLRGLVLPVGGIKEKVLAASRAGITEVILPERNQNDLDDVPESARKRLRFHFVTEMTEVLRIALGLRL